MLWRTFISKHIGSNMTRIDLHIPDTVHSKCFCDKCAAKLAITGAPNHAYCKVDVARLLIQCPNRCHRAQAVPLRCSACGSTFALLGMPDGDSTKAKCSCPACRHAPLFLIPSGESRARRKRNTLSKEEKEKNQKKLRAKRQKRWRIKKRAV